MRHLRGFAGSLAFGGDDYLYRELGGDQRHHKKVDLGHKTEVMRVVQQCEITHVKHQARESHVNRSITGSRDSIRTNIVSTMDLLEAYRGF